MLVTTEVTDYHTLGMLLGLKFSQIEIFGNEKRGNTVLINMKILITWITQETKSPTTWLTLIQALCEMDMKKLASNIIEKLEQRLESN